MEWVLGRFIFCGKPFQCYHFDAAGDSSANASLPLAALERAEGEIGAVLWAEAAEAMLRWLEPCASLQGSRVLELGAGCGFVGLALAARGARVTLTDKATLVPLLELNASLARAAGCDVVVRALDWAVPLPPDLPQFDLVVGCDLLYGDTPFEGLARVVAGVARVGARFRLAVNKRDQLAGMARFVGILGADFEVEQSEVDDVVMLAARWRAAAAK
jgi:predicted nicotinamide N-methyase